MWLARMMTWSMYACIGLLTNQKNAKRDGGCEKAGGKARESERNHSQSFAVVGWLGRDVERDPTVWTVERDGAHFLQVARARACAHGERGGRVGIVELVA